MNLLHYKRLPSMISALGAQNRISRPILEILKLIPTISQLLHPQRFIHLPMRFLALLSGNQAFTHSAIDLEFDKADKPTDRSAGQVVGAASDQVDSQQQ